MGDGSLNSMSKACRCWLRWAAIPLVACLGNAGAQDGPPSEENKASVRVTLTLPITTQGPLWPPGAVADENGDFIVVGATLERDATGQVALVPGRSVIVSRDTVPPLDPDGRETFLNPLGAPYHIIRSLDLSEGSADRDRVLYSNSYGPPEGAFGGGPRVPAAGVSAYNLNSFPLRGQPCPDVFPSQSQRYTYTRPSFPLHRVPVAGFQGDQQAYDPDTGAAFRPRTRTGSDCPSEGCAGENRVDQRRQKPISLGEWLQARVKVEIELIDFDAAVNAYTAARFNVKARNLLPGSLYQVFALRSNLLSPRPVPSVADPLGMPSIMISDAQGRARLSVEVPNPFPDPALDDAGLRIIGITVAFRSGFQNDGACATRYGPGVDVHSVANSFADGTFDFTDFVTREKLPPKTN